jgi:NTP pyrophosphatase (non-canonical NTP hydrolase)
MDFDRYQEFAIVSAIYNQAQHSIVYPAIGLGNEAGEVLGKIKKVLRDNSGVFGTSEKAAIIDEMGDVLWYLAALARDLDTTLNNIALANIIKLEDRRKRNVIGGSGDKR